MFTSETISLSPHLKLPHLVVLHASHFNQSVIKHGLLKQASYHKLCAKKMNCMPLIKCLKSYHVRCTPEPLNRANDNV